MRFALLAFVYCGFATALLGEDAPGKWGGCSPGGPGGIDIGAVIGGGGGGCDPVACDAKVRCIHGYPKRLY